MDYLYYVGQLVNLGPIATPNIWNSKNVRDLLFVINIACIDIIITLE